MVDKNLFLYDLAIVAIFKDEGRYLKEWLDYHLLAGVEHFYLYNNESSDDYKKILVPYVEENLVTLIDFPGKAMQMSAYNDAIKKFRFECRYMAFIDLDEFIYPKSNRSIVEVVDEILSKVHGAVGLVVHWQCFGTNGHDKADYSRGVLERFTRRAEKNFSHVTKDEEKRLLYCIGNVFLKIILNPRYTKIVYVHDASHFEGRFHVNESGIKLLRNPASLNIDAEKIVVNHYFTKSREEFIFKHSRGRADSGTKWSSSLFDAYNRNDVFDDGILKYRAARAENFSFESDDARINRVISCLFRTLTQNSPYAMPKEFFAGKLEMLLTCWALAEKFQIKIDNSLAEEVSLGWVHRTLTTNPIEIAEVQMLLKALPEILSRPFPICKEINQLVQNSNLTDLIEPDELS
ncbi:MAG: glycosyltransferase family 92 protein [Selenomonadaceae bacterium]|nr:glycosyltransferase family 92 protein [Selenomonadaceae bacterium]